MFIFGTRNHTLDLGTVETRYCPVCEKERPFKLMLQYIRFHLWYIFSLVTKRRYFIVCDICHRGQAVDRRAVEQQVKAVPLPFMHQFGCLTLFLAVIVFFVAVRLFGT